MNYSREDHEQLVNAAAAIKTNPAWQAIREKMIEPTLAQHDEMLRRCEPKDLQFIQGSRRGLHELLDFVDNVGKADPPPGRRPFAT